MKRIYLIDCPGVVPPSNGDNEEDILLRGVVRVENVENPAQYISAVMRRAQTRHLERTYEVKYSDYNNDATEFLSILARKGGRLLRGGEPDLDGVAKMVLNDFLRGKIPWFSAPPKKDGAAESGEEKELVEGREGRLGEMPGKGRKRKFDEQDAGASEADAQNSAGGAGMGGDAEFHSPDHDDDDPENGLSQMMQDKDVRDRNTDTEQDDGSVSEEGDDQKLVIEHAFESFSNDEEDSVSMVAVA